MSIETKVLHKSYNTNNIISDVHVHNKNVFTKIQRLISQLNEYGKRK